MINILRALIKNNFDFTRPAFEVEMLSFTLMKFKKSFLMLKKKVYFNLIVYSKIDYFFKCRTYFLFNNLNLTN